MTAKVFIVAQREFLSTVRRKSYLIITFGMPFFVSLYVGLIAGLPTMMKTQQEKDYGLVDEASVIAPAEVDRMARGEELDELRKIAEKVQESGNRMSGMAANLLKEVVDPMRFRIFKDKAEGIEALRTGAIERLYIVPADWQQSGGLQTYQPRSVSFSFKKMRGSDAVGTLLSRSLLATTAPPELRTRIEDPIRGDAVLNYTVDQDGAVKPLDRMERLARVGIPAIFAVLFLFSILFSSGYLLQGVAEEKENRVIEIILSSIRPHQLLAGKLLGLGAAGLVQLVIWIAVGTMAVSLLVTAALAVLDFNLFIGCLVYFVLGFLMLGSLMTGTGALGTNARESQQLATIWTMLTVMPPSFTWFLILNAPNGALARTLGWFPLTSPITMMLRLGTGQVPWWDKLLSVVILCVGVVLALRLSGALFRLGLLMYGKRPTLGEVIRQLRHA